MSDWSIKYQGHIKSLEFSYPETNFIDFKSTHNIPLTTFRYNHSKPRGLVFLFHGLHISSSIFTELAHNLHLNHFVSAAFDQPGHGLTGGDQGTVYDFDDLTQNCVNFVLKVKTLYSEDLPIFLVGLSMGGSMCIMAALKLPNLVKGIILYGPALAVDPHLQPMVQKTVHLLNNCCCRNIRLLGVDQKLMTHNPYYPGYHKDNPEFFSGRINVRTFANVLDGFRRVQNLSHNITCSVLLVHGEQDKITSCIQSQEFVKNCKSSDKEMLIYPEMYHGVVFEPEFPEIMEKSLKWIQARS